MKPNIIFVFAVCLPIIFGTYPAFGQLKHKKGTRLQIMVISTLSASSLTMEKMPAYVPITGVGLFGVGFVIDLKQNKKNHKVKSSKVKLVRI